MRRMLAAAVLLSAVAAAQRAPGGAIGIQYDQQPGAPGVRLLHVVAGGPAQRAGLRPGDVIVQFDGAPATRDALVRAIGHRAPGSIIRFIYLRGGKRGAVRIVLQERDEVYARGAALDDAIAQAVLGDIRFEQSRRADACRWWLRSAENDYAPAQVAVGQCYLDGPGRFPKDAAQAVAWFRRAADQGNAVAQFRLAMALAAGAGVPRDTLQAARWARAGAALGYAPAIGLVGQVVEQGVDSRPDPLEAARWYVRAKYAAGAELTRDYVGKQLARLLASGSVTRAQLDALEREEEERARAAHDAARLKTGSLHVASIPGGAQVYLDGVLRGTTGEKDGQLLLEGIAPGSYRLRLSRDGHGDWEREVTVIEGVLLPVDAAL